MLILKNVTAVQLHPAKVQEGVDIAIENDVIVAIGDALTQRYPDASYKEMHGRIARGIAIRPEVLLLDEPCSALDPISTGRIEELITELKQDYTVVIVTHNMQQAARCSDHTAFMYLGELIEFSNTDDLFTKPAKKQTEDYITGRYG